MTALWKVISKVESSDNQFAIRFEPTTFQAKPIWILGTLPKIAAHHPGASQDTLLMIACTSWGYYQILGANIWANGYVGNFHDFLTDDMDQGSDLSFQEEAFEVFIKPHGYVMDEDCDTWNEQRYLMFATFYNGPGEPQLYATAMQTANAGLNAGHT
jgi:hypothetical protein